MVICLLGMCGMGFQYTNKYAVLCCIFIVHASSGIEIDTLDMRLALLLLTWSFSLFRYQFTVCSVRVWALMVEM